MDTFQKILPYLNRENREKGKGVSFQVVIDGKVCSFFVNASTMKTQEDFDKMMSIFMLRAFQCLLLPEMENYKGICSNCGKKTTC